GALAPPDSPGASLAGAAGRRWGLVVDDAAPHAVAAAVQAWEAAIADVLGRTASPLVAGLGPAEFRRRFACWAAGASPAATQRFAA
ncbi:MAG: hypothetical protein ACRDD1_10225, partial [Planctomycetia bacterium]